MNKNLTLKKWDADMTGVGITAHGISIHAELYGKESNGILLYDKNGSAPVRIDFPDDMKLGNSYQCLIRGMISPSDYTYLFHEDGRPVLDHLAKGFVGHRLFGREHEEAGEKDSLKGCSFVADSFDWQGDKRLKTPYEDSIYYGMHVRGFTKDASSRIKEAGTFAGVQKKIPYLKKLGVTGIVLQPVYEFEECMKPPEIKTVSDAVRQTGRMPEKRLNYWGYLPGYYLAPKNAYAYGEDAVTELKTLVKQLHKNGLEIILQFYFEPFTRQERIRNILLYWLKNYHIDGFQLLGADLPLKEIALEPVFSDTKLWNEGFPYEEIAAAKNNRNHYFMTEMSEKQRKNVADKTGNDRFLATCNRKYEITIRKFLKGDSGMISDFLSGQRNNPEGHGQLNYFASYHGFRLADVVSYDRKHNEANGEENRDGEDINNSWNCGIEGETRKKNVLSLRMKQMKNALVMLFTAQGTPFLFMGDEWGKSSGGNNNPYCMDNEITWQKWNLKKSERELLSFTRQLIALRRDYRGLHQKEQLKLMDYLSCGYPDLSYHGQDAWRPDMGYFVRHIGTMLCGKYCGEDGCLYIAYNMHWEPHEFALPKPLKKGRIWKLLLDTEEESAVSPEQESTQSGENHTASAPAEDFQSKEGGAQSVILPGRSIRIYKTVEDTAALKRKRIRKSKISPEKASPAKETEKT